MSAIPRILICASDSGPISRLETALEQRAEVERAQSGLDALEMLDSAHPDLIVIDYEISGIDAASCCRAIRKNSAGFDLPIVALADSKTGELTDLADLDIEIREATFEPDDFADELIAIAGARLASHSEEDTESRQLDEDAEADTHATVAELDDAFSSSEGESAEAGPNDTRAERDQARMRSEISSHHAMTGLDHGARIYLIDPAPDRSTALGELLNNDYDVTIESDAVHAFDAMRANPPHLALVEMRQRRLSGLMLLQLMRVDSTLYRSPVILLADSMTMEEREHAFRVGAFDVITRPIEDDVMRHRVANCVMTG